jgi:hypothetical protein
MKRKFQTPKNRIGVKACGGKKCGSAWTGDANGTTKIKVKA